MKARIRELNGYRVVYEPTHHSTMSGNWEGYVYEHRLVAEEQLKRPLEQNEHVHHLDGNKQNNRWENLLVLDKEMHYRLHGWMDRGAPGYDTKTPLSTVLYCEVCERTVQGTATKYCSAKCCALDHRKVDRPNKQQLEHLIKTKPWTTIGKEFGVSDNAVRKWARNYGLI